MNLLASSSLIRRLLALAGCACVLALNPGCLAVAAGAGAGAVAFVEGKLVATLNVDLNSAGSATHRALDQLGLITISDKKDAFTDNFVARTADDKKVTVVLTRTGDRQTKVEIRVGVFGDKDKSSAILDRIRADS